MREDGKFMDEMKTTSEPKLYTSLRGLARLWGISPATAYRWLSIGLPTLQPAGKRGRRLIDLDAAKRWLEARSAELSTPPSDGSIER